MYTEEHSIYFSDSSVVNNNGRLNGENTWTSWHLIPTSRPSVASPQFSPKLVDVPGREDGPLDISEYLTGGPTLGNRTGSWEFYVDNDHEYWMSIYQNLLYYLHGKRRYCMLDDEPSYYYVGRFTVGNWSPDKTNSKISISYNLEPIKYPVS